MCLPVCLLIYELRTGKIKRQFQCDLKVGSKEQTKPSGMSLPTNLIHKAQKNLSGIFHFPFFLTLTCIKGEFIAFKHW